MGDRVDEHRDPEHVGPEDELLALFARDLTRGGERQDRRGLLRLAQIEEIDWQTVARHPRTGLEAHEPVRLRRRRVDNLPDIDPHAAKLLVNIFPSQRIALVIQLAILSDRADVLLKKV
jgi:hypothetical protein